MLPKPKLYVQYRPVGESLQYITDMQSTVADQLPAGRPMPFEQIHLTMIHYGKVAAIYETLKTANPDLAITTYEVAVEQFVRQCHNELPNYISTTSTELAAFGPSGKVIVVKLAENETLMTVQSTAASLLLDLFSSCGIADPIAFQKQDYNFQFVVPFHPHITLLKQAPAMPNISFKAQLLELQLMPLWYD